MIDQRRAKLEIDAALGERKREVFEQHIAPFIEAKERILFEAFQGVSAQDAKQLQAIKMQQTALASLADYFREYIDTGKLAAHELEKYNENQ